MENLVSPVELSSFFNKKKVFVTGHTGFKGAWLTAILSSFAASVRGYALEQHPGGLFDHLRALNLAESIIDDIRNKPSLEQAVTSFQPDIIFHLAAQPLVRRSYEIPAETFEVNVSGTANVLEAAMKLQNPCAIVVVTTDKVYQNKEQNILYNEDDALGGYDPYSSSKACAELVVDAFRKSFFDPFTFSNHGKAIASARAGNVIGGGDWSSDRIIPDIINSLASGRPVAIRNPHAIRPWQHVLEAISGYLMLAQKLYTDPVHFSKPYNLGPLEKDHLTVKEFVEIAIEEWGEGSWEDVADKNAPHEAGILKLDISRALKELKWKPVLNAREAIAWTVEWYRVPATKRAGHSFAQIEKYFLL